MRRIPFAVALLLIPIAFAGSADAPEVSDPADDVATSGGSPLQPLLDASGEAEAFDDVDLLAAWFTDDGDNVTLTIRSSGAVQDATTTVAEFSVEAGPTSETGSTADGSIVSVSLTGTTVDSGPTDTAATASDADLVIVMPRASLGAVGGDVLTNLTVERSRSAEGVAGVAEGQDAEDRAPDEGAGDPYTLSRPPVVPALTLEVIEIQVREGDSTRHFAGMDFTTTDPTADISVTLRLTNTGSDADTVHLAATATEGSAAVDNATIALEPGASGAAVVTLRLDTGGDATVDLSMAATSDRGAVAAEAIRITVATLPPIEDPAEEETAETTGEGRLSWLTPAAEGLGLDSALGDQAEPVLLGLIVFLAALLVALVWWLLGRGRRDAEPAAEPTDAPEHPGALDILIGEGEPVGEVHVSGVHIQEVGHAPSDPQPGDDVTTTLVLRNELSQGVKVRARMEVDGHAVLDQMVALLVRGRIRLRVPWTAGDGPNRVHIEILPP